MINEEEKGKLVAEAKDALSRCYPKDTPYKYAAAVLTADGNIYSAGSYGSFTASLRFMANSQRSLMQQLMEKVLSKR